MGIVIYVDYAWDLNMLRRYIKVLWLVTLVCSCNDNGALDSDEPPQNIKELVLEPDNPKVTNIINHVSRDSLETYVRTMVNFFTRHTNSDTMASDRGIGAARRWVSARFEDFSRRNGERLRVYYHNFEADILGESGTHRNVIAELPGMLTPERKFVVSGHLDSRNRENNDTLNLAPGANDDASGVAVIIELARIISQFEFESTLIFVAFTGEEQGLFGSRAYAQYLREMSSNVVGMVTNDVVGNVVGGSGTIDSTSVRCFSDDPMDSAHRQLARFIKIQGETYLPGFTVNLIPSRDRPGRGGDHFAFNEQGYTGARLTEPEDNLEHQHNMRDLPEFMSFLYLSQVARINAAYLSAWADAPQPPTDVQVTSTNQGQLRITWTPSRDTDVAGYLLAIRPCNMQEYRTLLSAGKESEIILAYDVSADGMFVSVSAVDEDGNESIFSKESFIAR